MQTSQTKAESKRKDTRIGINDRRAFIVRHLRAKGIVSLSTLFQHSKQAFNPGTLESDVAFLNELGFVIQFVESDGRRYLVDAQARHIGAKSQRTDLNAGSKQAVATAACSLVMGVPPYGAGRNDNDTSAPNGESSQAFFEKRALEHLKTTNPELGVLLTRKELRDLLIGAHERTLASPAACRTWSKLEKLWKETHITAFCDAGTTTDRMGSIWKDIFLPTAFSPLSNLRICTNSSALFHRLADPEVSAKAIVTGGYQLGVDGSTDSIAGGYTDAWLNATESDLKFGICFIGCTAVEVGQGFFLSDSYEEKNVKEIVLRESRSQIRVILADRSKFKLTPIREGFRFAAISPEVVDVIITNAAPETGADDREAAAMITHVRENLGVPVIEAPWTPALRSDGLPKDSPEQAILDILCSPDYRVRIPKAKIERGLEVLGLGHTEPNKAHTKYVNHSMEMLLNVVLDSLLDEREPESFKASIKKRFARLRKATFLDWRDVDQSALVERVEKRKKPKGTKADSDV